MSAAPRQGRRGDPPLSLDQAKRQVSLALLGRDHVHGVGLRREQRRIVLYVDTGDEEVQVRLRSQAEALATPFQVEVVKSERAGAGGA